MQLVPGRLQESPKGFVMQDQLPIGLHSKFSVGIYSPSLCHSHDIRKAAKVFAAVFLLCMRHVAQGYMVPVTGHLTTPGVGYFN